MATSFALQHGDTTTSRSLNLDFLDSLADLPEFNMQGDEMVPVDSFFDSYVDSLAQAGTMSRMDTGDGTLLPLPQSLAAASSGAVSTLPQSGGLLSEPLLPQQSGAGATDGFLQSSAAQPTTLPLPIALPSGSAPATSPPASSAADMPPIPVSSADDTEMSSRGGRSKRSAGRGRSIVHDDPLHHLDHDKTKRNPKQQLQNKQAQQRYRERRKQRFNEMETALSQLSEQMQARQAEFAGLQSHNSALQGQTQELQEALAAREAEMASLKSQLAAVSAAGGPASSDGYSTGTAASHDNEHDAQAGGSVRLASGGMLSQSELAQSRVEYDALVSTMRELAERHGLRSVNPLGEGVVPEVLGQVRELVSAGCHASQALDRKGGIAVLEVMGRDVEKVGTHTCAQERQRWGRIMHTLRLAPRQEEALLALRKQHLARLKEVYQTRQSLNMQAMGMMLPTPSQSDVPSLMAGGDPTLEGKMACMSIGSYLSCARNTLALDGVLDQLKDNLREEQKTFMEMKLVTLHRVLSPIQTLLFVIEAYPARPDALALSNSVALKMGKAAEGCPKAAELLKAAEEEAARSAAKEIHNSSGGGSGLPTSQARTSSTDSHKSDCCSLSTGGQ